MDKVEVTEADREAYLALNMLPEFDRVDVLAGRWDNVTGIKAFARHRITTEAATRAKVEGEIVAWLLKDDTRLRYEESAPEAEREHFSWWAADAITQGTYK